MRRRCHTPPPNPLPEARSPALERRSSTSASGQATVEFVALLPTLLVGGAIVLQGLAIAIALLVAQVSAESLAAQAASGVERPSISRVPVSPRLARRMHLRAASGQVTVEAPRLLPMPRVRLHRDVVAPP